MKKILCLICILSMLFTAAGCASKQTYAITYDDVLLYVTPVTEARPGDVVPVVLNAREGASFLLTVNGKELSPHDRDEYFLTYEFVMPYNDVRIEHTTEEVKEVNNITIPASMTCHRISYSTEFAFDGKYMIITNSEEATRLFAGFSLAYADQIEPYPDGFFDNNIIIACLQHEGSGSVGHSLKNAIMREGKLFITITREVPYIGTCDMASWLCLISVSKKALPPAFDVTILTENKEV